MLVKSVLEGFQLLGSDVELCFPVFRLRFPIPSHARNYLVLFTMYVHYVIYFPAEESNYVQLAICHFVRI